jgi:1-phosphofructokinase family hexose kinase
MDYGGKGFNVSRLLNGMGVSSTAFGFLGGDTGRLLENGLKKLNIDTSFLWVPGETRTNISIVTGSHDHYIKVNEKGPLVDDELQQELLNKVTSLTKKGDWWVLAGSLPPGVSDDYYAHMVHCIHRHGARAILDTNGEALRLGCAANPFLVKPNVEEAKVLSGLEMNSTNDVAAAAALIRALGAQNVVISMGKTGALLHNSEYTWLAHSPKIRERNPIGAGDSMVGGLVWALVQGFDLQEALGWGVASGAATASLDGTKVGPRQLIEELYAQVKYERIEIG